MKLAVHLSDGTKVTLSAYKGTAENIAQQLATGNGIALINADRELDWYPLDRVVRVQLVADE